MGSLTSPVSPVTCDSPTLLTMKTILVGVCLQLFLAQGLFYDLLKDNKLSKRKGSSYSGGYERRLKKKSEYVCSSSKYSQRTRRRYNCDEKTHKNYSAHSAGKTSQPCYDDNKYCASWASLSECSKNPSWMLPHCPIACGLCTLCEDFNQYCQEWAKRGECSSNRKYMKVYCKKSCSVCTSGLTKPPKRPALTTTITTTRRPVTRPVTRPGSKCRDKNPKCGGWAKRGYCSFSKHHKYMNKYCKRTCNKCRDKSSYP